MAEVFVPHSDHEGVGSRLFAPADPAGGPAPLSNGFEFPAPGSVTPRSSNHTEPQVPRASYSQRLSHQHKPSNLSISSLPPFDFGGSNQMGPAINPLPSPTRSPSRLNPPSGHLARHKRAGSEFVGGDITHGGPVLVNTASTDEEDSPNPPSPKKGPPAGRRGHAHRRSHAVSQSDIKITLQPNKGPTSSSDPSTPSDGYFPRRPDGPQRARSHPGPGGSAEGDQIPPLPLTGHRADQARSRVGFSDHLEYISRPLSTISSETSSSMSTVRASHSVSDSMGSISNSAASISPPFDFSNSGDVITAVERTPVRPVHNGRRRGASSGTNARSSQNVLPSPDLSQTSSFQAYSDNPHTNVADEEKATDPQSVFVAGQAVSNDGSTQPRIHEPSFVRPSSPQTRPRTSPELRSSGKQQRVKNWADMIIHRKERQSPTAQFDDDNTTASHSTVDSSTSNFSLDDVNLDEDTTMIIEEPSTSRNPHLKISRQTFLEIPQRAPQVSDNTQAGPMIDLDAALMSPSDADAESSNDYLNKSSTGKRRLHSSGETGGFVGPGMHYHRRTESAPEIESFERSRFGMPRFGSNPALEEAIEEEDEEPSTTRSQEPDLPVGLGVSVVEAADVGHECVRRSSAHLATEDGRAIRRAATPPNAYPLLEPIEIVDAEEEPRFSMITKSSDESSITPTVSPDPLVARPVSAPLDSALQTPSLTYGTTPETPSVVSSADYKKTSFDVREPRLHTARSSLTDRATLNSSKAGDFSASSIDDVPSLTSSSSTMMSGLPTHLGVGSAFGPTQRSSSLSASVPFRSRPGSSSKRASLASLSKLMGGPYNRSRLNIAESVAPDTPTKPEKRRHRISRMVKFWKAKETISPDGPV